ncbi:LamG-like jellyroll fold domain-containing protein [Flavobacterium sp.]|uniref:LamG-like jellyroll fold domain-containing protein n=3 Tax=Flavobacterium sp. TaxID=239 RepID=UPI004047A9BD
MKKLLLFLVLISYGIVAQTPIWHYTFDGNSAPVDPLGNFGGALTRVSGGVPTAANYGMDRFGDTGKSLIVKSDGTNNFLYTTVLANLPQSNNSRTFSFWVRYKSNSGDRHLFRYGGFNNVNSFGMSVGNSLTATFINYNEFTPTMFPHAQYPIYTNYNLPENEGWYHYVVTAEASATKIYRNGVLLGTNSISLFTSGTNLKIGLPNIDNNTTSGSFEFLLDDFKVYDVVLSEVQIKQQYADEIAFNNTDLLAYYGFENDLTCTNNPLLNLTAQITTQNTYEAGVVGLSRKFQSNPVYNDVLGASLDLDDFTIMAWEKTNINQNATDFATVFETNGSLYVRRRQNSFNLGFAFNSTTYVPEGSNVVNPLSNWVHHAVTVKNFGSGIQASYFRNGELLAFTATTTSQSATAIHSFVDKFVLGGGLDGSGNLMTVKRLQDSNIDEVYVYNRVLNQSEILATMYRATAPTFTSCPTGDVTLTTQAEVDALASCSTISGFLIVNANNAALDLSPLNNITTINGALVVQGLTNNQLNIFPNLTTVTGSIQIRQNTFTEFSGFNSLTTASNGLQVLQNTNLTSFSGFNSLSFINGNNLGILLNNNLATINAFSNLQNVQGLLIRNTQLTNLSFLSSLIGNGGQLSIESNPSLTSANFANPVVHCFCSGISGGDYVRIQSNPLLATVGNVTLQSSVLGQPTIEFFQINNNPLLSSVGMSLDASATSSSVVGNLNINNNPALSNLNFLSNINVTSCGTLNIGAMPVSSLASLSSLTSVGTIQISGNTNLNDISALNNISIGNITSVLISVNPLLATCAVDWVCDYLATASPNATIAGNATGCESVAAVNSACAALSNSDFDLAAISLYPNPTDAIFSIEVPNEVIKKVRIFDVTGKMLLDSNQATLNVSSFASGIYMINIETESGKIGVSKLIKK